MHSSGVQRQCENCRTVRLLWISTAQFWEAARPQTSVRGFSQLSGFFLTHTSHTESVCRFVARALKPSHGQGSVVKFHAPAVNGWREMMGCKRSPALAEKCPQRANFQGTQEAWADCADSALNFREIGRKASFGNLGSMGFKKSSVLTLNQL